jgi:hypothetical protein
MTLSSGQVIAFLIGVNLHTIKLQVDDFLFLFALILFGTALQK